MTEFNVGDRIIEDGWMGGPPRRGIITEKKSSFPSGNIAPHYIYRIRWDDTGFEDGGHLGTSTLNLEVQFIFVAGKMIPMS